ncbi:hypothetical protein AB205_0043330 [Aquarana catesbeiana]|uniref:CYRIA/CYRIB Rac1 binding domain-containing protein n=1 Tax=Aquarana catesbeiana TaxID=8400 RepID=A0A2G9RB68_AQUCT|nr:hypothetical protein AB205_0043330 [Aquarana catesbeiana]
MASVCRVMLETPEYRSRFTNEETVSFCLRVMVGVIILYDHVHPVGAFAKTSKIDVHNKTFERRNYLEANQGDAAITVVKPCTNPAVDIRQYSAMTKTFQFLVVAMTISAQPPSSLHCCCLSSAFSLPSFLILVLVLT